MGAITLLVGEEIVPGGGGRAFGLHDRTRAKRWEHRTADRVSAGPVSSGLFQQAKAIMPAGGDGLYALDQRAGAVEWNAAGVGHACTPPGGGYDSIYLGTGASEKFPRPEAVADRDETGEVVWRTPLPLLATGRVYVFGGRVLVPLAAVIRTEDGYVHAVDADSGRAAWVAAVGSPVVAAPDYGGKFLFAATASGRISLLEERTGEPVGRFDLGALTGGPVKVRAVGPGPRTVLVAEATTLAGPAVRVYCLECEEWFRR